MKGLIKTVFYLSIPFFLSCKQKVDKNSISTNSEKIGEISQKDNKVSFDSNEAYKEIEAQLSFGYRIPGTKAHLETRDYLKSALEERGLSVVLQEFDGRDYFSKKVKGYNIIGKLNTNIKKRVLLLAHWDSRQVSDQDPNPKMRNKPIMAADDGAASVAVILEILRQIKLQNIEDIGIDVAFVDIEDTGKDGDGWCQGSEFYAKSIALDKDKAEYAILLDMVSAKGALFTLEQYSKLYAEFHQNELWSLAARLGYSSYFKKEEGGAITDDHVSIIKYARIPAVDIINYDPNSSSGFPSHWHTQNDNIQIIDKETMTAVGETVLNYIIMNK